MKKVQIVFFNLVILFNFLYAVDDIRLSEYIADGFDYPVDNINANNYGYEYSQPWSTTATAPFSTLHSGIDINTINDCGREVKASANGVVVARGHYGNNWGGIILIKHKFYHENGFDNDTNDNYVEFTTQYAHIAPLDSIQVGDYVYRGQHIGYIAWQNNHNDCNDFEGVNNPRQYDVNWSPHLHFEVRSNADLVADNWENFNTGGTGYERKERVDNGGYFLPFNSDLNNHSNTRYVQDNYPNDVNNNAIEWFARNTEINTNNLNRVINLDIFDYTEDNEDDNRRTNKNHVLTKKQVVEVLANTLSLKLNDALPNNSINYAVEKGLINNDSSNQLDFNQPVQRDIAFIISSRVAQQIKENQLLDLSDCGESNFIDMEVANNTCKHINYLYTNNLFTGYLNENRRYSFSKAYVTRDFLANISSSLYDISNNSFNTSLHPATLISNNPNLTIDLSKSLVLSRGNSNREGSPIYYEVTQTRDGVVANNKDKFNIVVIDRSQPYRLRPIVDFTINSKGRGRFKTHSVENHIENKGGSIVIAAINGDLFGHDDGTDDYEENKLAYPSTTFLYGGIDLNFYNSPEPILTFSKKNLNNKELALDVFFHNIGQVNSEHDFDKVYKADLGEESFSSKTTSFINNGSFQESGKSRKINSDIDYAMGLKQGTILGYMYKDGKLQSGYCNNPDGSPKTKYGINWDSHAPSIAFNDDYIILAVSKTEIVENKNVCNFFKSLDMEYAAYLDAGGSTQMVIRNPDAFDSRGKVIDEKNLYSNKSPNSHDRAVLSGITVVSDYPDLQNLDEKYKRAIYYLTDFGISNGDEFGNFGVGLNITRAEFSKIIINLLKVMQKDIKEGDISKYRDINDVNWFANYAKQVVGMGLIEGQKNESGDWLLRPADNITYWELSKMISVAFQGTRNLKQPENGDWVQKYSDCLNNYGDGYSNRFKESINNIFDDKLKGIYDEDKKEWFSPYATREDVALFLYRAFILWQDNKFDDVSKSCVEK